MLPNDICPSRDDAQPHITDRGSNPIRCALCYTSMEGKPLKARNRVPCKVCGFVPHYLSDAGTCGDPRCNA